MFCNQCGKELSEDTKFCPSCGKETEKQDAVPAAEKSVVTNNRPKCSKCGAYDVVLQIKDISYVPVISLTITFAVLGSVLPILGTLAGGAMGASIGFLLVHFYPQHKVITYCKACGHSESKYVKSKQVK